jgi:hypothetical protein
MGEGTSNPSFSRQPHGASGERVMMCPLHRQQVEPQRKEWVGLGKAEKLEAEARDASTPSHQTRS